MRQSNKIVFCYVGAGGSDKILKYAKIEKAKKYRILPFKPNNDPNGISGLL